MKSKGKIFLLAYYERQINDIKTAMDAIPENHRLRDIHKMRVRIKRVRSVFRVLEYMYPDLFSAREAYSVFKPVFKSAGLIREAQINLRLMREFHPSIKLRQLYYRYTVSGKSRLGPDLDRVIHTFNYDALRDCDRKVEDLIAQKTETELINSISGFINSEAEKIKNMLYEQEASGYIHEVRIVLKNIKPLLGLTWRRKDNSYTKAHYESLNNTETLIGDYHDRVVLLHSLEKFFEEIDSPPYKLKEEYLSLHMKLLDINRSAYNKIRESLAATLSLLG